jgi:RHS repeat-associated protein
MNNILHKSILLITLLAGVLHTIQAQQISIPTSPAYYLSPDAPGALTLDEAGGVTSWKNLNNFNITVFDFQNATAANRPTVSSTVFPAGNNAVFFGFQSTGLPPERELGADLYTYYPQDKISGSYSVFYVMQPERLYSKPMDILLFRNKVGSEVRKEGFEFVGTGEKPGLYFIHRGGTSGLNMDFLLSPLSDVNTGSLNIVGFNYNQGSHTIYGRCNGRQGGEYILKNNVRPDVDGVLTDVVWEDAFAYYNLKPGEKLAMGSNGDTNPDYFFRGWMGDVIIFNGSLNKIETNIVENFLAVKYRTKLSANDFYNNDYESTGYIHEFNGVGKIDDQGVNSAKCGILDITLNSSTQNNYLRLFAHNNADEKIFTGTLNTTANFQRIGSREWYFDGKGADGSLDFSLDKTKLESLAAITPQYQKYALIIQSGNFSNPRIAVLDLNGDKYEVKGVSVQPGEKVALAVIQTGGGGMESAALGSAHYNFQCEKDNVWNLSFRNLENWKPGDFMFFYKNGNDQITSAGVPAGINYRYQLSFVAQVFNTPGSVDVWLDASTLQMPAGCDQYVLYVKSENGENLRYYSFVQEGNKYVAHGVTLKNYDNLNIGMTKYVRNQQKTSPDYTFREYAGQLSAPSATPVTVYPHTDENFSSQPACMSLSSNTFLKILFNSGDKYDLGNLPFNATATVNVKLYDAYTGGNLTGDFTANLTINQDSPEQLFNKEISALYPGAKRAEYKVTAFTCSDVPASFKSKLQVQVKLEPEKKVKILSAESNLIINQSLSGIRSRLFRWDGLCEGFSYQFQLLKLENQNADKISSEKDIEAKVDWSRALTVETPDNQLLLALTEGTGFYLWRVRPVGNYYPSGDSRNWGAWTDAPADREVLNVNSGYVSGKVYCLEYDQFDEDKNFIHNRVFTENGQMHESVDYANGLLQGKQSQNRINSNDLSDTEGGEIMVQQQVYDFSGRNSLLAMPAPDIFSQQADFGRNEFAYRKKVLQGEQITGLPENIYTPFHFDTEEKMKDPAPVTGGIVNSYYSPANPDQAVPSAESYPYARSLYYNDGTNRVKESGGSGQTLQIGKEHTVRTSYSSVADDELIRIFGAEAPAAKEVIKTTTTDQNNISSVTYTNSKGQVIATCLQANPKTTHPNNLDMLPSETAADFTVVDYLKENTEEGKGIVSSKSMVFQMPTSLVIDYGITQKVIEASCGSYCNRCAYVVTVSVFDEDEPANNKIFTTKVAAGTCSENIITNATYVDQNNVSGTYPVTLSNLKGKYIVKKKIELDESAVETYAKNAADQIRTSFDQMLQPLRERLDAKDVKGVLDELYDLEVAAVSSTDLKIRIVKDEDQSVLFDSEGTPDTPVPADDLQQGYTFKIESSCCNMELPVFRPTVPFCQKYPTDDAKADAMIAMLQDAMNSFEPDKGIADVFPANPGGVNYGNLGEVRTVLMNMLQETGQSSDNPGHLYSCETIHSSWSQAVDMWKKMAGSSATYADSMTKAMNDPVNKVSDWQKKITPTFNFRFFDFFFDVAGKHYKGFVADPLSEKLKFYPYLYFHYNPVPEANERHLDCEQSLCNWQEPPAPTKEFTEEDLNYTLPELTTGTNGTYQCSCTFNYFNLETGVYNYKRENLQIWSENELYAFSKCLIAAQPKGEITYDEIIASNEGLISQCKESCDLKYEAFMKDLSIELSDGNGAWVNNGVTLTYSDLCCTAEMLVEDCKTRCKITPQYVDCGGVQRLASLGSKEELTTIQNIIGGSFTVSKDLTKDGVDGFGKVEAQGSQIFSGRCISGTPTQKVGEYDIIWDTVVNQKSGAMWSERVLAEHNGFYYLGITANTGFGNSDYLIIKIDKDGNKIWEKNFGGSGWDHVMSVVVDNNGYIYAGGQSDSPVGGSKSESFRGGEGYADFWVIKIDQNGNKIWDKVYGGDGGDFLNSILLLNDGNLLLAGGSTSGIGYEKSEENSGESDSWILKVNPDGNKIWDKSVGGLQYDEAVKVIKANDEGFIVGAIINNGADFGVFKIDESGNVMWEKKIGDEAIELMETITSGIGGGYVVSGVRSIEGGLQDIWVVKISNTGTIEWEKTYGGNASMIYSTLAAVDDGYLFGGLSSSDAVRDVSERPGEFYGWLVKIDGNGNKKWDKSFNRSGVYNRHTDVMSILQVSDGILVAGDFRTADGLGKYHQWMIKLGDDGFTYNNPTGGNTSNNTENNTSVLSSSCHPQPMCIRYERYFLDDEVKKIHTPVPYGPDVASIEQWDNLVNTQLGNCIFTREEQLKNDYRKTCMSKQVPDELRVEYKLPYHHYTLYYYDRAGNLMRTVPPQGVDILPLNATTRSRTQYPNHRMVTKYDYNSLKQLVKQSTPDGGTTEFVYNAVGQLRISANAQQVEDYYVSYSKYDALGRITDVGEYSNSFGNSQYNIVSSTSYDLHGDNSYPNSGSMRNRTLTVYSVPASGIGREQEYTLNRVSYSYTDEDGNLSTTNDQVFMYYSYDPHGNVKWMKQDVPGLGGKYIDYEYDLISGKVTLVKYNEGQPDQFFHRYTYDADNRIVKVQTSKDGQIWETDATYDYYKHGPLKRTEIGQDKIQGLDYVYTIHGWIKGINHTSLTTETKTVADVWGMTLNYFRGDYKAGNTLYDQNNSYSLDNPANDADPVNKRFKDLYNGNIAAWSQNTDGSSLINSVPGAAANQKYTGAWGAFYSYDYLNRIKNEDFTSYGPAGYAANPDKDYNTSYTYDANGNILSLNRNAVGKLDELSYEYREGEGVLRTPKNYNQLEIVKEHAAVTSESSDLENQQGTKNYSYDNIGNLTKDLSEGIEVKWNVYGKISEIKPIQPLTVAAINPVKNTGIKFRYDPAGNRTVKEVLTPYWINVNGSVGVNSNPENKKTHYYVRDASGNIMATYKRDNEQSSGQFNATYRIDEHSIYGSDRVGVHKPEAIIGTAGFPGTNYDYADLDVKARTEQAELNNLLMLRRDVTTIGNSSYPSSEMRVVSELGGSNMVTSIFQKFEGKAGKNMAVAENAEGILQFYFLGAEKYFGRENVGLLYDRSGNLMLNSGGINADANGGSVAIVKPGSTTEYYLFTTKGGLLYRHTIDMSLPGNGTATNPAGDVKEKNILVSLNASGLNRSLAVIENIPGNKASIFAVANGTGSDRKKLVRLDVTAAATTETVVVEDFQCEQAGDLKISPDRKRVALYAFWGENVAWFSIRDAAVYSWSLDENMTVKADENLADTDKSRTLKLSEQNWTGSGLEFGYDGRSLYYNYLNYYIYKGSQKKGGVIYDLSANQATGSFTEAGKLSRAAIFQAGDITGMWHANPLNQQPGYLDLTKLKTESRYFTDGGSWTANLVNAFAVQPVRVVKLPAGGGVVPEYYSRRLTFKYYELSDHLGNVRIVVTDRMLAKLQNGTLSSTADVKSFYNYYAFGMMQPGRFLDGSQYRYGFNGKEMDNEVKGVGNQYDYGFRIYDSRIGKFLSRDPLAPSYPWYTPYQFAGNKPIAAIDLDGLEELIVINKQNKNGEWTEKRIYRKDFYFFSKLPYDRDDLWTTITSNPEIMGNFIHGRKEYKDEGDAPDFGTLNIDIYSDGTIVVKYDSKRLDDNLPSGTAWYHWAKAADEYFDQRMKTDNEIEKDNTRSANGDAMEDLANELAGLTDNASNSAKSDIEPGKPNTKTDNSETGEIPEIKKEEEKKLTERVSREMVHYYDKNGKGHDKFVKKTEYLDNEGKVVKTTRVPWTE